MWERWNREWEGIADYNCKHRLLASVAYILPSILSLRKFSHFNQCRISRHLLSLLVTWFPRLFVLLRRTAQSFGPLEILVGFIFRGIRNAKPIAQGRVRQGTKTNRSWFNVHVQVCRLCVHNALCASRAMRIANNSKET